MCVCVRTGAELIALYVGGQYYVSLRFLSCFHDIHLFLSWPKGQGVRYKQLKFSFAYLLYNRLRGKFS